MYTGHRRHRRMVAFLGPVGPSPRSGKARGVRWTQLYVLHVRLELDGLYWHDFLNYMRMLICKTSSTNAIIIASESPRPRRYMQDSVVPHARHLDRHQVTSHQIGSTHSFTVCITGLFSAHATNSYSQRLKSLFPLLSACPSSLNK